MLTLWNPNREFARFSRDLDDLFGRGFETQNLAAFNPEVDVQEYDDRFVLRADLPGVEQKDIDVRLQDGVLTLSGTRTDSVEEDEGQVKRSERRFGSFSRQFRVGQKVDSESISAAYKNGVLTVQLPKRQETQPRQIEIAVH